MRILIVGASGMLGSHLLSYSKQLRNYTSVGTSAHNQSGLKHLDITKIESIQDLVMEFKPDCIVNCAAKTNVDECEQRQQLCKSVNSTGAKNVAEVSERRRIRVIHISTDSVFDGKIGGYSEECEPNPINTYARTKREGEKFVSSIVTNHVLVRTNFYGIDPHGRHLLNWILTNLKDNKEITGFDSLWFNPLWVSDLTRYILELVAIPYRGLLHCTGNEIFSKYEFIRKIAFDLGYHKIRRASGSTLLSSLTPRPMNTCLTNDKMRQLLPNTKIHTLEEVLRDKSFDIYRSKTFNKIS